MHAVNPLRRASQRDTAGWLKEVAQEQKQRKRSVHMAKTRVVIPLESPPPRTVCERFATALQHLFYHCCYTSRAKAALEAMEATEQEETAENEALEESMSLSSPPSSVISGVEDEEYFGIKGLREAKERANAHFAPYVAREMRRIGVATYEDARQKQFGQKRNALISVVHGEVHNGALPPLPWLREAN